MNTFLKCCNVVYMFLFWVSFFTFCSPFLLKLKGQIALNLLSAGLLGSMFFIVTWGITLDIWYKSFKN